MTTDGFRRGSRGTAIAMACLGLVATAAISVTTSARADEDKTSGAGSQAATRPAAAKAEILYATQIKPLLSQRCGACHGDERPKGGLSLSTRETMLEGGKSGAVFVAGKPDESLLIRRLRLPEDERGHMPPANKPQLTEAQIKLIEAWVAAGASFEAPATAKPTTAPAGAGRAGSGKPASTATRPAGAADAGAGKPEARDNPSPADPAALAALTEALVRVEVVARGSNRLRVDFAAVAKKTKDPDAERLLKPILPQLESLSLARCGIGDETVKLLADAPRLRRLDVRGTQVTDAGLAAFARHPSLRELVVVQTKLTDAAVEAILTMPALQRVSVWKAGLSPEAVARLRKERPKLQVEGGDAPNAKALEVEPDIKLSSDAPPPK